MTGTTAPRPARARQAALVHEFGVPGMSADAELDGVVRLAAAVTGRPFATVNTLDTRVQHQLSAHGFRGLPSPRAESVCATLLRDGGRGVHAVPDLTTLPELAGNPWVDGRRGRVRGYATAPVEIDGELLGALCVFDEEPHAFTRPECERLADLAAIVGSLFRARRQTGQLADLAAASQVARSEMARAHADLVRSEAFVRALLDVLPVGVVGGDAEGRVTLFNQASRRWHGLDADPTVLPGDFATAFFLTDADGVPLAPEDVPLARVYREGRLHGAEMAIAVPGEPLRWLSADGAPVRDDDGRLLGAVVTLADVTEQRRMEEQLRAAALHDPLTGLPNRSLLFDRLAQSLAAANRDGRSIALLYCDLDGFKPVNDTAGHAVGDQVLVDAARRLLTAVRPGDTVARMGGDEFVVVCPDVHGPVVAEEIAERITGTFARPLRCAAGDRFAVGISIGITLAGPDDDPESVLHRADAAMYEVKAARRATAPAR